MSLLEQITNDLNMAMKGQDQTKVSTLRFLIAGLHNAKIAKGEELTDDEVISEISKEAKRHKESIEAYEKGARGDLAEKEKSELNVLEGYLPEQLTDEEIEKMVSEAIEAVGAKSMSDVGRVIGAVMGSAGARADGAKVSELVRKKLGEGA